MKPADDRCEEHGLYLYREGFGWSCKLGCYYCEDPQKIKEGFIQQYKKELKEQIEHMLQYEIDAAFPSSNDFKNCIEKILKLLE